MKPMIHDSAIPTIGILIFHGFLTNEVLAPIDVFTKKDSRGEPLFNVITIAKEQKVYDSEEGLHILPDFTFLNCPELNVLVVPGSLNPDEQLSQPELISFIKEKSISTDYIASHCAGAFLLGEAELANDKKIVTYCSGGEKLKQKYPELIVMDDMEHAVVKDGKIISSNGSLVSYLASLNLLEELTSTEHRKSVEDELLLSKLKA